MRRRHFFGRLAGLFALGGTRAAQGARKDEPTSARFITSSPTSAALRRIAGRQSSLDADLLSKAADEIDSLRDALFWCAGSPSFAPEGEAHEGWRKVVEPLMRTE